MSEGNFFTFVNEAAIYDEPINTLGKIIEHLTEMKTALEGDKKRFLQLALRHKSLIEKMMEHEPKGRLMMDGGVAITVPEKTIRNFLSRDIKICEDDISKRLHTIREIADIVMEFQSSKENTVRKFGLRITKPPS